MNIKNYDLIKNEDFDSLGIKAYHFSHIKTGARVVFAKANDKNKTYGIGFKTPPTNSKGMAHIMEHSVLNGSEKFRTKDPFMDMDASSLNTFLNAMTYPDKTVFPVSSENARDFKNLVSVYTDAVFAPLVLDKKEIFDQEAWHYDLEDGKITGVSGVVYNEMQGALSDPESLIYNDLIAKLYEGSCYEYQSGGNPADIKDLSFDEFIDFYRSHYHPSNAYIYFYGDIENIEEYLGFLDEEYLSKYEKKDLNLEIEVRENTFDGPVESTYPANEEKTGEDYLSYAMLTHSSLDIKETLAASVLVNALFNMDSSKIRQEISRKLSPEYFFARNAYGNRSALIIQAQKVDAKDEETFVEIIESGLKEAAKGLNKEALKSAFSLFDFGQRENLNSVSAGLNYYLSMSFDADPFEVFRLVDYLKELRDLIDTDYYENFIKKYYLDNPTRLIHISRPDPSYNEKKKKDFEKFLEEKNEVLGKDDLGKIKDGLRNLKAYQDREDTEEEKATIPKLDLEDVPTKTQKAPRLVEDEGFEYVFNDLNTAGLSYVDMYFDLNHLSLEDLAYAQLIAELMGSVDTANMKYTEADDIIWQKLGSLGFSISNFRLEDDKIDRTFKASFKTIGAYTKEAVALVKDFLKNSDFSDKRRVIELLRIRKSVFESKMYDIGHMIAINRANSHLDPFAHIQEKINGISYYQFIKKMIDLANEDFDKLLSRINEVYERLFSKDLSISIKGSKDDYELMKEAINESFDGLKERSKDVEIGFEKKSYKEALATDANVNYVSKSARLKDYGLAYDGTYLLAGQIMTNPYLYSLIRAKGGAYGAGMIITRAMNLATYSYRDPNIEKTISAYDEVPAITKDLEMSKRDFENQQISAMGSILKPKAPKQLGDLDYSYYRMPQAKKEDEILAEIKGAKLDDIRKKSDIFKKAMAEDNLVVFGNRDQIKKIQDLFDEIIEL